MKLSLFSIFAAALAFAPMAQAKSVKLNGVCFRFNPYVESERLSAQKNCQTTANAMALASTGEVVLRGTCREVFGVDGCTDSYTRAILLESTATVQQ